MNKHEDFRRLELTIGEKYTLVWYDNLTGIVQANIKLVDFYIDSYAQYENCLYLDVIIGKRRTIQEMTFTPNESVLIVKGTHKINFNDMFNIEGKKGILYKTSKYTSMSSEWIKHARSQVQDNEVVCYQY